MIYLKPIGGLCNRMRTIDSLIAMCKISKRDITVLWVQDASLNCGFGDLFEIPVFDEFDFKVIDCPAGFPESFIKNPDILSLSGLPTPNLSSYFLRNMKNILRKRFLNNALKETRSSLNEIGNDEIVTNEELNKLYASEKYGKDTTVRDMDSDFIPMASKLILPLLSKANNKNLFISSCYRVYPLENPYLYFTPVKNILKKVENKVTDFKETIGLHIRRSDHKASKAISTEDKFIEIIEKAIEENEEATFFLSTDDEDTKEKLLTKFKGKIIVNEVSSYDRNSAIAVIEAMVDLYCLSKTKLIFGSHHSSFSQTAADIGEIEEFTVK